MQCPDQWCPPRLTIVLIVFKAKSQNRFFTRGIYCWLMVGFKTKQCYNLIQSDPSVGEQLKSEMKSELATVGELSLTGGEISWEQEWHGRKIEEKFWYFCFSFVILKFGRKCEELGLGLKKMDWRVAGGRNRESCCFKDCTPAKIFFGIILWH